MGASQSNTTERFSAGGDLYVTIDNTQWPIVYRSEYNIGFYGLENVHPFDSKKWGRIYNILENAGMVTSSTIVQPKEATETDLLVVHTRSYLNSLKYSYNVASIMEVPCVACLPNAVVQSKALRPFRYQTAGTVIAAKLAVERGWAINIGGGFHHCSSNKGGGFCAYADITLAIRFLFDRVPTVQTAMIIDLDAHQGNGHERDFLNDAAVYIMDVYNNGIYPHDTAAKKAIRRNVPISFYTEDEEYLRLVSTHVEGALNEFTPDIVVYNAGTDILINDSLGALSITREGVIRRDEIVFEKVRARNIPIVMVTSGGYQRSTAEVIASSILNLWNKGLISLAADTVD